jgi:hypothetical protein
VRRQISPGEPCLQLGGKSLISRSAHFGISVPLRRAQRRRLRAGYCVRNDVGERVWQTHTASFTLRKAFDTSEPKTGQLNIDNLRLNPNIEYTGKTLPNS